MLTEKEILEKIADLAPWAQNISIKEGISTPGPLDTQLRWDFIKNYMPRKLKGMRVFEPGCNAGFFSLKSAELGADYVLGIDFEHYIAQANLIKKIRQAERVDFQAGSIYKMPSTEKFDITLCLGLIYHLKYPFLALKIISDLTSKMILLETEYIIAPQDTDKMKFIEHTYRNDGTVWWLCGEECIKGMLRSVGFKFVKSYRYPSEHLVFGKHYSQGKTEEGMDKGSRLLVVGLKELDAGKIGMLLSEIPELEKEIDLNNLDLNG